MNFILFQRNLFLINLYKRVSFYFILRWTIEVYLKINLPILIMNENNRSLISLLLFKNHFSFIIFSKIILFKYSLMIVFNLHSVYVEIHNLSIFNVIRDSPKSHGCLDQSTKLTINSNTHSNRNNDGT